MWFKLNWHHSVHGFALDWVHPLTPLLTGNLYLLMWQLCDLPTSGSPRSNSASSASVEVSQLLFSHNSGSAKLSFTNGKRRSLWNQGFLWNQVLLLVSSYAEPMEVLLNFPSQIWRLGERMSGLALHSEALKDWVQSPGHLSPSPVPYLDSIYLRNNNSNTPFATWTIHRP